MPAADARRRARATSNLHPSVMFSCCLSPATSTVALAFPLPSIHSSLPLSHHYHLHVPASLLLLTPGSFGGMRPSNHEDRQACVHPKRGPQQPLAPGSCQCQIAMPIFNGAHPINDFWLLLLILTTEEKPEREGREREDEHDSNT